MLRRTFVALLAAPLAAIRTSLAAVRVFPDDTQRADAREVAIQYGISEVDALRYLRVAYDLCHKWDLRGAEARQTALDLMHTSARLSRAMAMTPDEAVQRIRARA